MLISFHSRWSTGPWKLSAISFCFGPTLQSLSKCSLPLTPYCPRFIHKWLPNKNKPNLPRFSVDNSKETLLSNEVSWVNLNAHKIIQPFLNRVHRFSTVISSELDCVFPYCRFISIILSQRKPDRRPMGHTRYINILTWLRGFQDKPLHLVLFSGFVCKSLLGIERQKKLRKNCSFDPNASEPRSIDISNVAYCISF